VANIVRKRQNHH